jgi:outer membrane lipoprotein-sorting protein
MTNALALLTALATSQSAVATSEIIQPNLHDMQFTAYNKVGKQSELVKINKDFGESYRFDYVKVWAEEPFKLRLESKSNDTDILYILNGTTRIYSIPRAKLRQKEDLAKGPGKRQTWLDFGLITKSMVDDLFVARFVRTDRATGDLVFDLTYPTRLKDTSRHRIWVDKDKRYITKREWYSQKGPQMATFFYEEPKYFDGVWVPTKVTVKNVDNRVAGVTEYSSIRVNNGISDSLFKID